MREWKYFELEQTLKLRFWHRVRFLFVGKLSCKFSVRARGEDIELFGMQLEINHESKKTKT